MVRLPSNHYGGRQGGAPAQSSETTCGEDEKAVVQGDNQFACEDDEDPDPPCENPPCGDPPEPPEWLEQIHTALSILAGFLAGFIGYRGARWVDGEYQVKGGFKPFKGRSLSRVKRRRMVVGVIGAVAGFAAGTLIALQIPLLVQVIVILGAAALVYFTRFR